MITVQMIDGHHAGCTLNASLLGFTPQDILCGISGYKWRWETDYSQATEEEHRVWSKQDMTMRMVRALAQGLPVTVLGTEYRANSLQEAFHTAAQIEDLLLTSGDTVVEVDDASGIVITSLERA